MAFVVHQARGKGGGFYVAGPSFQDFHHSGNRPVQRFRIESLQWTSDELIRTPLSPLSLETELKEVVNDFAEVQTIFPSCLSFKQTASTRHLFPLYHTRPIRHARIRQRSPYTGFGVRASTPTQRQSCNPCSISKPMTSPRASMLLLRTLALRVMTSISGSPPPSKASVPQSAQIDVFFVLIYISF